MANSRVGQYRLEFELTGFLSPTRSHVVGIWIAPTTTPATGTPPADIDIQLLGGGTDDLDSVALDFANRVRPLYPAAITISGWNMWKYITEYTRDFVTAGSATPTTTAGGSSVASGQHTLTFRHAGGGIGKHVFLESSNGGDSRSALVPNATGNSVQRYAAWVLSATSPVIALDNAFAVAPLKDSRGQNEAVWRKINRQ